MLLRLTDNLAVEQLNYMDIFRDDGAIDLLSRIFQELYPKADIIDSTVAMKKPYTIKMQGIRVELGQLLRDDRF